MNTKNKKRIKYILIFSILYIFLEYFYPHIRLVIINIFSK